MKGEGGCGTEGTEIGIEGAGMAGKCVGAVGCNIGVGGGGGRGGEALQVAGVNRNKKNKFNGAKKQSEGQTDENSEFF